MIPRYAQLEILGIWSDDNKLILWQGTELAVLEARVVLGQLDRVIFDAIAEVWAKNPVDLVWWKNREKETNHDLDAFLDERRRWLPLDLRPYPHQDLTSYDTEESAFVRMLGESVKVVEAELIKISLVLRELALKYRYTIMMARTHGQEAELQTFGKRCFTWRRDLQTDIINLLKAKENLAFSKISGAVGNYGGIKPELEKEALRILGFRPYYGAKQIMPRELYAPLAESLFQIVATLNKIAIDIRLGARSGLPICQEPFGRQQKGSSRMPHKKNTISTEQIEGMERMAKGFLGMILDNIKTWEERAIEQSCVERVAWPDLFHVVIHSLRTMERVLRGLAVYPDNMLREVINSRGCYAAGEAKEFLASKGVGFGLSVEEAYRIVQLAAFNVFEPSSEDANLRQHPAASFDEAAEILREFERRPRPAPVSIKDVISQGRLRISSQLEANEGDVARWNEVLQQIFREPEVAQEFDLIFSPAYLLWYEAVLFDQILKENEQKEGS